MAELPLNYEYISDQAGTDRVLTWLGEHKLTGADSETTGLDPFIDSAVIYQFGDDTKQWIVDSRVVPIEQFKPILEDRSILKFGQNLKFDCKFLLRQGIDCRNVVDTMINEQVIRCGIGTTANLEDLAMRYLRVQLNKDKDLRVGLAQTPVGQFTKEQLDYMAADIVAPRLILKHQKKLIDERGLRATIMLESQIVPILAKMELQGMLLDTPAWLKLYQQALEGRSKREKDLDNLFGIRGLVQEDLFGEPSTTRAINYSSSKQMLAKLASMGYGLGSYDKDDLVIAAVMGHIPADLARAILGFKYYNTLITRFGLNFLDAINPITKHIHSEFTQASTHTGRFSSGESDEEDSTSKKINFQNITKDPRYRACFIPDPGYKFSIWDYQSIEPRILGEMSQDPMYIDIFKNNKDIYGVLGSIIYGEEVSKRAGRPKELRSKSKIAVLGTSYGTGQLKFYRKMLVDLNYELGVLADTLTKVDPEESEMLRKKIFEICPTIKVALDRSSELASPLTSTRRVWDEIAGQEDYKTVYQRALQAFKNTSRGTETYLAEQIKQLVGKRGNVTYSQSINGRKRFFKVYSGRYWTEGRNHPIQATAGDIIKLAMVKIDKVITDGKYNACMINQVHDELMTQGKEEEMPELNSKIAKAMVEAGEAFLNTVPVGVEGGIYDKWQKE